MSGPFLDTNILIYAYNDVGDPKSIRAWETLRTEFVIGVQTLNEFVNVCRRRLRWNWQQCRAAVDDITLLASSIVPTLLTDHELSLVLAERYQLSVYDALMLAIAIRAGCDIFYSEDMHHGLVIDKQLTITNPFA